MAHDAQARPSSSIPEEYQEEDLHRRFQVSIILGKGAYGTVYKAVDRTTGDNIAIKVIPLTEQDKEDFKQIQREIAFLADCNHPNVVRYLGSYRHRSELWIAMEYCGGGSVSDLMQATGAALSEEVIAHICCEALKGLAYLHSLNKIHRDIKCGNILLSDTGDVKIADFGVSAQLTSTMSKRQTFIGTPHWMAPEVIKESRYDCKVDVWALGISAIEMAESVPPRWAVHPLRVIFMISRDPPPKLAEHDKWGPVFHDFLAQALLKEPKMRPSARYLLQHRFVVHQRQPGPPASLQPLIARTQQYLANHASPAAPPTGNIKIIPNPATGKFTMKGGTVVSASNFSHAHAPTERVPEPSDSPAGLGAGGRAGGRSKLAAIAGSTSISGPDALSGMQSSGTLVISKDYGDTTVVHDSGTTVLHAGDGDGGSMPEGDRLGRYGTVRASDVASSMVMGEAEAEPDVTASGGYLAAVKAAANDAQKAVRAVSPSKSAIASTPQKQEDKLREKLQSLYEGGLVLPVPFLRAAHAQPLALLNPIDRPMRTPMGHQGGVEGIDPDAYDVLLRLVQRSAALSLLGGGREQLMQPPTGLPPSIVSQVIAHPALQNLARTLAYHQRSQQLLPLDKAAGAQLQLAITDLSDTLKCMLCL